MRYNARKIIPIIILLICLNSISLYSEPYSAWLRYFYVSNDVNTLSIDAEVFNNSIYYTFYDPFWVIEDTYLAKIGLQGSILWINRTGDNPTVNIESNNTLMAFWESDGYVMLMDTSGIRWVKTYAVNTGGVLGSLNYLDFYNGKIYLVLEGDKSKNDSGLSIIDAATGTPIAHYNYTYSGYHLVPLYLAIFEDYIYVGAYAYLYNPDTYNYEYKGLFLVKLDTDGVVQKCVNVSGIQVSEFNIFIEDIKLINNNLWMFIRNDTHGFILIFDKSLSFIKGFIVYSNDIYDLGKYYNPFKYSIGYDGTYAYIPSGEYVYVLNPSSLGIVHVLDFGTDTKIFSAKYVDSLDKMIFIGESIFNNSVYGSDIYVLNKDLLSLSQNMVFAWTGSVNFTQPSIEFTTGSLSEFTVSVTVASPVERSVLNLTASDTSNRYSTQSTYTSYLAVIESLQNNQNNEDDTPQVRRRNKESKKTIRYVVILSIWDIYLQNLKQMLTQTIQYWWFLFIFMLMLIAVIYYISRSKPRYTIE